MWINIIALCGYRHISFTRSAVDGHWRLSVLGCHSPGAVSIQVKVYEEAHSLNSLAHVSRRELLAPTVALTLRRPVNVLKQLPHFALMKEQLEIRLISLFCSPLTWKGNKPKTRTALESTAFYQKTPYRLPTSQGKRSPEAAQTQSCLRLMMTDDRSLLWKSPGLCWYLRAVFTL